MRSSKLDRSVQLLIARVRQHGGPLERRNSPRSTYEIPTTIYALDEGGAVTATCDGWIQDLSDFGVGVLSETTFSVNQRLILNVEAASGDPCALLIQVHRCTQLFDGCFKIGAKAVSVTTVPADRAA